MSQRRYSSLILFEKGVTLLEMLMALTVSLVLLLFLSTAYLATERHHQTQTAMAALQMNAVVVAKLLANELKQVGYFGCLSREGLLSMQNQTLYPIHEANQLSFAKDHHGLTQITVRHRSKAYALLKESMRDNQTLSVLPGLEIKKGDVLVLADCKSAAIFPVVDVIHLADDSLKVTAAYPLNKRYLAHSEVGHLEINTYFIATPKKSAVSSLYRKDLYYTALELVAGVERIEFFPIVHWQNHFYQINSTEMTTAANVVAVLMQIDLKEGLIKKKIYEFVRL